MCKRCEQRSHRRNDNKYFGMRMLHLMKWADGYIWKLPKIKKGNKRYLKRFGSEFIHLKYGGWMRKNNGVFQWNK